MRKIFLAIAVSLLMMSVGYGQGNLIQQYSESGSKMLPELRDKLKTGTPIEKEEVLYVFMEYRIVELVPDVIAAILDSTPLPRDGDTGWGYVYHQAATALCNFAYKIDGITQKQRGYKQFSFFNDGGIASEQRRQEVYGNWLKWWKQNKTKIFRSKLKE